LSDFFPVFLFRGIVYLTAIAAGILSILKIGLSLYFALIDTNILLAAGVVIGIHLVLALGYGLVFLWIRSLMNEVAETDRFQRAYLVLNLVLLNALHTLLLLQLDTSTLRFITLCSYFTAVILIQAFLLRILKWLLFKLVPFFEAASKSEIEQFSGFPDLLCVQSLLRPKVIRTGAGIYKALSCPCGQPFSRNHFHTGIDRVIGVIGQPADRQPAGSPPTVAIPLWDPDLQQARPAELDHLVIGQSTQDVNPIAQAVTQALKNNLFLDDRKLKKIPVTIDRNVILSVSTRKMLTDTFGSFSYR
jgi:hypothetical protein